MLRCIALYWTAVDYIRLALSWLKVVKGIYTENVQGNIQQIVVQ